MLTTKISIKQTSLSKEISLKFTIEILALKKYTRKSTKTDNKNKFFLSSTEIRPNDLHLCKF